MIYSKTPWEWEEFEESDGTIEILFNHQKHRQKVGPNSAVGKAKYMIFTKRDLGHVCKRSRMHTL